MARARMGLAPTCLAAVVLLAAACGSDGPAASGSPTGAEATTTSVAVAPLPDGFPAVLITSTIGNDVALPVLSAVDTSTGASRQLVDVAELGPAFGFTPTNASIGTIDVSPDGSTVAFSVYAGAPPVGATRVFTVPADGSAPATLLASAAGDGTNAFTFSPDGRWLAVYDGALRLVPVATNATSRVPRGIQLPYPPRAVIWAPDSTWLLVADHGERTSCPLPVRVDVDPATGALSTGSGTTEMGSCRALPWIDPDGVVHRDAPATTIGTDPSGRFVLGSRVVHLGETGSPDESYPTEFVWWDATAASPTVEPLGLDLPRTVALVGW